MAQRGKASKSFLREPEFAEVIPGRYDIEKLFEKDTNGNLVVPKRKIARIMDKLKIDRHIVLNAVNLQNYTVDEIKDIIQDFKNYIDEQGFAGVLEFHANDKTQNSFHFHFWCDNDSLYVRETLKNYLVTKGYAARDNVDIQKYDEKTRLADEQFESKSDEKVEVVTPSETTLEIRQKTQSIFDKLRASARKIRETVDYEEKKESIKSQLCKIPDGMEDLKIEMLKKELSRRKNK